MSGSCEFTVIMPTTGDKAPVIGHAIRSVLSQSVSDFELFVVGDGAGQETRRVVESFAARDDRVQFAGFEKHDRRGEPHRHELIETRAAGRYIAYICDRDLWCVDHLAELRTTLRQCDFAHSMVLVTGRRGVVNCQPPLALRRHAADEDEIRDLWCHTNPYPETSDRGQHVRGIPLSAGAHGREAYLRSGAHWDTTPPGWPTDHYMWRKLWLSGRMTMGSTVQPTVIYFPTALWQRDLHAQGEALAEWIDRATDPAWIAERTQLAFRFIAWHHARASHFLTRALKEHDPDSVGFPSHWCSRS